MKKAFLLPIFACVSFLAGCATNDEITNHEAMPIHGDVKVKIQVIHNKENAKSLASKSKYPACNTEDLAKFLTNSNNGEEKFMVELIEDDASKYNYYNITNQDVNADNIRGRTCEYINSNKCYIYWGNVAGLAMIAKSPAPKLPLDASPSHVMSPELGCGKLKTHKKGN